MATDKSYCFTIVKVIQLSLQYIFYSYINLMRLIRISCLELLVYNEHCVFVLSSFLEANDAGETPLDLARRLRHSKCEELVSVVFISVFKG